MLAPHYIFLPPVYQNGECENGVFTDEFADIPQILAYNQLSMYTQVRTNMYIWRKKIRCDLTNNPADTSEDISKIDFMCSHGLSLD